MCLSDAHEIAQDPIRNVQPFLRRSLKRCVEEGEVDIGLRGGHVRVE